MCVCVEWRSKGEQTAAGLSVSDSTDKDGPSLSRQLHPRPGNTSLYTTGHFGPSNLIGQIVILVVLIIIQKALLAVLYEELVVKQTTRGNQGAS